MLCSFLKSSQLFMLKVSPSAAQRKYEEGLCPMIARLKT